MLAAHQLALLPVFHRFKDDIHIVILRIKVLALNIDGATLVIHRNRLLLYEYSHVSAFVRQ